MDTAVTVALVTSGTSLAAASASLWFQRTTLRESRDHQRRSEARVVLERYRGPLLSAATELGDRIDNIRTRGFAVLADGDDIAKLSTLFRSAQYLGWREILRTEVQLLRFEDESDTRVVAALVGDIVWAFASQQVDDGHGMLWAEEQRGIGELMTVVADDGSSTCRGYASFVVTFTDQLGPWMDKLAATWLSDKAAGCARLRLSQWALFALVLQLDEEGAHSERAWIERVQVELTKCSTRSASPLESRVRRDVDRVLKDRGWSSRGHDGD